jgi:hypothetical protein
VLSVSLPPFINAIDNEIAGHFGWRHPKAQILGAGQEQAERRLVSFLLEIMVHRLDAGSIIATSGKRPHQHRRLCLANFYGAIWGI